MTAAETPFDPAAEQQPAVPSFTNRFVGMLLRPRETMRGLREPDAWLGPAILLFIGYTVYYIPVALGIAEFASGAFLRAIQDQQMDPSASRQADFLRVMSGAMWTAPLFSSLWQVHLTAAASWAIRTALFYFLGRAAGGEPAPWYRVLSMVGWAWVPLFIQYVLIGLAMLMAPQVFELFVPLPSIDDMREGESSFGGGQQGSLVQVLILFNPFVVWNLVLCTLGLEEIFKLPRWKAALIVFIPTLLQVLLAVGLYLYAGALTDLMGSDTGGVATDGGGPSGDAGESAP